MSFTVDDFEDLLRLLYERPEWQERLRRAIMPPELFELPRLTQELIDANRAERERVARLEAAQQATRQELREGFSQTGERIDRLDTRVGDLDTRVAGLDTRVADLDTRVAGLDTRVAGLDTRVAGLDTRMAGVEGRLEHVETDLAQFRSETTARFDRMDARFDRMDVRMQLMSTDLGVLKGNGMEERFRARVPEFRHLVPDPVALTPTEVAALLDGEVAAGRLLPGDARRVERADLIVRSTSPAVSPYLVLEVSWLVDERDVRRANDRAALLRKAGYDARGAVAGTRIQPEAVILAERLGVARRIDEEIDEALDDDGAVPDDSR